MIPAEVSELDALIKIIKILGISALGTAIAVWVVAYLLAGIESAFGVSFPVNFK